MITIDNVSWTYPHAGEPSLVDLDLHIAPGEFVIICGASGSGKSTALRLINGLVPEFHDEGVLSGEITVDDMSTTGVELDAIGLSTGTVLQHPRRQFFADSVPEELAFAMENFGFPRDTTRSRVAAAVTELRQWLPIEERLQHLSGGQQQQVAISAATMHQPRVLLLDEPSANLSADAVERLVATLTRLKADGVTIVVAEHRLRYLQHLVDRVIVMRNGRIDAEWTADEFRAVSDEHLEREGLRGVVQRVVVPDLPASGRSVATPSPSDSASLSGLTLRGIRCRLGGRDVIDIDHAHFATGEVTAVRGVNGAGKSTLARIITGLQRSAGAVSLNGRALTPRTRQRASAIVMQDVQRQLFTDSVRAEIELARTDTDEGTGGADLLDELDLARFAERHPLALSGGQQQRLVVAAVRASQRSIVIFDEPSSGVDRRHLRSIADQIRAVAAGGAVVVLISHDDDLLALAADRQLVLQPTR